MYQFNSLSFKYNLMPISYINHKGIKLPGNPCFELNVQQKLILALILTLTSLAKIIINTNSQNKLSKYCL